MSTGYSITVGGNHALTHKEASRATLAAHILARQHAGARVVVTAPDGVETVVADGPMAATIASAQSAASAGIMAAFGRPSLEAPAPAPEPKPAETPPPAPPKPDAWADQNARWRAEEASHAAIRDELASVQSRMRWLALGVTPPKFTE